MHIPLDFYWPRFFRCRLVDKCCFLRFFASSRENYQRLESIALKWRYNIILITILPVYTPCMQVLGCGRYWSTWTLRYWITSFIPITLMWCRVSNVAHFHGFHSETNQIEMENEKKEKQKCWNEKNRINKRKKERERESRTIAQNDFQHADTRTNTVYLIH